MKSEGRHRPVGVHVNCVGSPFVGSRGEFGLGRRVGLRFNRSSLLLGILYDTNQRNVRSGEKLVRYALEAGTKWGVGGWGAARDGSAGVERCLLM